MTIRRRTYPELLDSMLTSIVGGVAAEEHPFPPPGSDAPPYDHSLLQPPVATVVSLYGSLNGQAHAFVKDVDFQLLADGQTLHWTGDGSLPDEGTNFLVNYVSASAHAALDDLYAGSVMRTLAESTALEMARLYAQLEAVYAAGFVDTAPGASLDNVVALLGLNRIRGGRAAGQIEFARAGDAHGEITILAGTRVMTADGKIEYETTATVTMAARQNVVRVVARDLAEPSDPQPAGVLTVLPVPIQGITSVTNPAPTARTASDESDEELRIRTKAFLHGSERATLGALRNAIGRQQLSADVEERGHLDASGNVVGTPGVIDVTPQVDELDPELQQRLLAVIEEARPAGVLVRVLGSTPPQKLDLELRLVTGAELAEQDLRAAHAEARKRISDYFAALPTKAAGSINQIVGLVLGVPGIQDMSLTSATIQGTGTDVLDRDHGEIAVAGTPTVLGELRIADPNLPTDLDVVISYPHGQAPPDADAIKSSLQALVATANATNSAAGDARASLGYADLLAAVPLPSGQPQPYTVEFVFAMPDGVTRQLRDAGAEPYTLAAFERVVVGTVTLTEVRGA